MILRTNRLLYCYQHSRRSKHVASLKDSSIFHAYYSFILIKLTTAACIIGSNSAWAQQWVNLVIHWSQLFSCRKEQITFSKRVYSLLPWDSLSDSKTVYFLQSLQCFTGIYKKYLHDLGAQLTLIFPRNCFQINLYLSENPASHA